LDVVVLCYHAVSETWPLDLSVRPDSFEQQLRIALDAGYTAATFHDAVVAPPAAKTFAVTFDDGWRSVKDTAWPIMRRLGVVGTVFVSSAYTDVAETAIRRGPVLDPFIGTEHEHELYTLPWADLAELQSTGWEIGSHCVHHPLLTTVDDDRLRDELTLSRARITEVMGAPCRTLAYPTGDHDERVVRFARDAGYAAAATLPSVFPRDPDPLAYPRVSVSRGDSSLTFRLKLARPVRIFRSTPLASAGTAAFRKLRGLSPLRSG
jgi:peptidoglycan/xylan/chitin deacetylase (PgdA/CDA1 family)